MNIKIQKLTLNFGEFSLDIDMEAPGSEPEGEPQIWIYNNAVGDGLEIGREEFAHLLKQYYVDFM